MTLEQAKNKCKEYNQEQILKYYDELNDKEKEALLNQIDETDFSVIERAANQAGKGKITPIKVLTAGDIDKNRAKYEEIGIEAIKEGKVAAVLLAGGMGTRLGSDSPKGCFNMGVTRELYIFECLINNLMDVVRKAEEYIHLFVMTSDKNHEATMEFFKEHEYFGYKGEYVHFFKQEMAPATDMNGKILLEENQRLQKQVDDLTIENIMLQQDRYELVSLRELYDLDAQYDDYEKVGARIIAKDSGNWFHSFVINKGSDDGLEIDMNVMAGSGLVGRITDLGPDWAKVLSIIDDSSNTSGMVLSTSDNLIVTGDLQCYSDGVIPFEKLVDTADRVVEGDKIVTSNVSDKYLPGILIGYISTINKDSNNLTKSGYLTPAVDFNHLNEVLVIKRLKQTVEE